MSNDNKLKRSGISVLATILACTAVSIFSSETALAETRSSSDTSSAFETVDPQDLEIIITPGWWAVSAAAYAVKAKASELWELAGCGCVKRTVDPSDALSKESLSPEALLD